LRESPRTLGAVRRVVSLSLSLSLSLFLSLSFALPVLDSLPPSRISSSLPFSTIASRDISFSPRCSSLSSYIGGTP
jgi:hypothetical protein